MSRINKMDEQRSSNYQFDKAFKALVGMDY